MTPTAPQSQALVPQLLDRMRNVTSGEHQRFQALKDLFWTELNYDRANRPLSTRSWPSAVSAPLAEDPLLFATGGRGDDFHITYARFNGERLSLGDERAIVNRLLPHHPYALFIFSNAARDHWHFLNVEY